MATGNGVEISLIVPAYNESKNLPALLTELQRLDLGARTEIVVVDDGSHDNTSQIARAAGAEVIRLEPNQGKGASVKAGFQIAKGRLFVQIDADRQFRTAEIARLLQPLRDGSADIVFGSRFLKGSTLEPGAMAWTNALAHPVICLIAWIACGVRVHDVMAGFKAFRRDCAAALELATSHFGYEAEILVKAGQLGCRVGEVPVSFLRRREGKSNIRKFRDGCLVLSTIARMALTRPARNRHPHP